MRYGGTPIPTWVLIATSSTTASSVTVQLLGENDFQPPGSTEDNTILLKNFCPALIPLVTGLLVHAKARPVQRSHIDTFLRPSLPRHTSCLYADWFRPTLGSLGERLQLPKLNRVGMPKLRRIFTSIHLHAPSGVLSHH